MDGPRYVANFTERTVKAGSVPLPGNDDHRGSVGILPSVMSYVAVSPFCNNQKDHRLTAKQGKGIHPDQRVPEKPLNMTQPTPQRVNAAGTHHYTKVGSSPHMYIICCLQSSISPASPEGLILDGRHSVITSRLSFRIASSAQIIVFLFYSVHCCNIYPPRHFIP